MEQRSPSFETEVEHEGATPAGQRLLRAILIRALRDFVIYRRSKPKTDGYKIAVDAAGWIYWDGLEVMSFRWVCAQINIDPENTRRLMLTLTPQKLKHMTPPDDEEE